MGKKKKTGLRRASRGIFGGAMASQATPMLSAAGRTTGALSGQVAPFVGMGVAGAASEMAFDMIEGRPRRRRKRRR